MKSKVYKKHTKKGYWKHQISERIGMMSRKIHDDFPFPFSELKLRLIFHTYGRQQTNSLFCWGCKNYQFVWRPELLKINFRDIGRERERDIGNVQNISTAIQTSQTISKQMIVSKSWRKDQNLLKCRFAIWNKSLRMWGHIRHNQWLRMQCRVVHQWYFPSFWPISWLSQDT